jgi:hypothetical protein
MIRLDKERYLKHTITDLETPNETVSTDFPVLGNYSCDSHFGEFSPQLSTVPLTQNSKVIFQEEPMMLIGNALFFQNPAIELMGQEISKKEISIEQGKGDFLSQIWTFFIDGSKSQEGSRERCILINFKG